MGICSERRKCLFRLLAAIVRKSNVKAATFEQMQVEGRRHGYTLTDTAGAVALHEQGVLFVDLRDARLQSLGLLPGASSFPMLPTLWQRLAKAGALKRLLGPDLARAVVFY